MSCKVVVPTNVRKLRVLYKHGRSRVQIEMNELFNASIKVPKINALFEHLKHYRYYIMILRACGAMV